jgi:hypothetical protein
MPKRYHAPASVISEDWPRWYGLARWKRGSRHQLQKEPFCRLCLARGVVTAAAVVDHITPHAHNWNAFWIGPLQSLCANCHNTRKRSLERLGYDPRLVGADGYPLDPNHPFNREAGTGTKAQTAPKGPRKPVNPAPNL